MEIRKRAVAIGALFIAFAAVMATQYATVRLQGQMVVTGKFPWIQFMAHDKDARDGGWLIRRISNTTNYTIYLANITGGQIKIWTAAFAIVNTENSYRMRVTGVRLFGSNIGNLLNYIEIVLHREPNKVGVDINKQSYDPPSHAYWQEDYSAKLYWKNGNSIDRSVDGWVLGRGNGYSSAGKMYYGTVGSWYEASYDSTYKVFYYNSGVDNNADDGADNFVWVQIVIDLSQISDVNSLGVALDQPLTIYIEFFFQGEPI